MQINCNLIQQTLFEYSIHLIIDYFSLLLGLPSYARKSSPDEPTTVKPPFANTLHSSFTAHIKTSD